MPPAPQAPFRTSAPPAATRPRWRIRRRWRQLLAAGLVLAALGMAALDRSRSSTVLVVRADLPEGHVLTAEDLQSRRVPVGIAPDSAISVPDSAIGAPLVAAAGAGEILTATRLATEPGTPGDSRLVSITVADPGVLALLHPGSVVDVVSAADDRPQNATPAGAESTVYDTPDSHPFSAIVVESVTVVDVPADRNGEPRGTLALSVADEAAAQLAAISLDTPLTVSIRR